VLFLVSADVCLARGRGKYSDHDHYFEAIATLRPMPSGRERGAMGFGPAPSMRARISGGKPARFLRACHIDVNGHEFSDVADSSLSLAWANSSNVCSRSFGRRATSKIESLQPGSRGESLAKADMALAVKVEPWRAFM